MRLTTTGTSLLAERVDLESCRSIFPRIEDNSVSASELALYNKETREAVAQLIQYTPESIKTGELLTNEGRTTFEVDHSKIRDFKRIDEILIADTVLIRSGIKNPKISPGAGVPLLARLPRTDEDNLIPESGLWIPLTAILDPQPDRVVFRLIDTTSPNRHSSFPVAANLSSALARDLVGRQKDFKRVQALLNFDKFAPKMGISRVFGFYPEKTPVVFVHGIYSSTLTWTETINELMADPEIRSRYEFWSFSYPTGAPLPYLSLNLRNHVYKMDEFRRKNGANRSNVILIGHSMGGLMAKTLTQQSGFAQWNEVFTALPSQLDLSNNQRSELKDMFYFDPVPFVDQVIFTATPHHGTESANEFVARMVEPRIHTPGTIAATTERLLNFNRRKLTPLGEQISERFPNSIQHMRPDSEVGKIFADLPLSPNVRYYSIIGSEDGLDVDIDAISDGIVTYRSAHIDGVVSEKLVQSRHSIHTTPEGIAEISRVLKSSR